MRGAAQTLRVLGLAVGLLAAVASASAQGGPRPRLTVVIQAPPAVEPVLRKPLGVPAAPRSPLSPAATVVRKGAVTPLKPASALNLAAQCRAQCAQDRYICTAQEAGDCDTVWGRCVVHCGVAGSTDAPGVAFSAGYRMGR
jgi:hypothetical protein